MKRPRTSASLAAVAAIVALFAIPAFATYRQVTDDPTGKVYASAYELIEKTQPGVKVDRSQRRNGTITREGGGTVSFQCARIASGAQGWVCIGLAPDGRSGAALWFAPEPNIESPTFLIGDRQALISPGE